VKAHEPAIPTTERQATNADFGICAAGNRQTECLRRAIEFAPQNTALSSYAAARRIDIDRIHERKVDHKPIVADR
jgi:hypothetical protein